MGFLQNGLLFFLLTITNASIFPLQINPENYVSLSAFADMDIEIGFMWTKSDSIDSLRFSKKDREDLLREGWNELNVDNYGVYHIQDNRNDVDLAFSLVRQDNDLSIRVEGDNMSVDGNINTLSLLMYILPKHNQTTIQIDCPIQSYSGIKTDTDCISIKTQTEKNKERKYRFIVRDDIQTHHPEYAYSRGFPFSLTSSIVYSNPSFQNSMFFETKNIRVKEKNDREIESIIYHELKEDENELKNLTSILLHSYNRLTHGRLLPDELQSRLQYPHIATLSNTQEQESNLLIIQRVIQTPFMIDFALIEEIDSSWPFVFASSSLSLETQMRVRLLTGFEFTEILHEYHNVFMKQFTKQFPLKQKGFSSYEIAMSISLFSNLLASISIHSIPLTTVYENCTTTFTWNIFHSCNETGCSYSIPSCGYEEELTLLILTEWNTQLSQSLFISHIYTLTQSSPSYCPPLYLLVLDHLLQKQSLELQSNEDDDLSTLAPIHQMAYDLLLPILYCIQSTMNQLDSSIHLLYTSNPNQPNSIHINMTSWMLFASDEIRSLLDFLQVDRDMQRRLDKRIATMKQKMVRWLWNEKEGIFDDIIKHNDNEYEHLNHLHFDCLLPFVLNIGQIGNIKNYHFLRSLFDSTKIYSVYGIRSWSYQDTLFYKNQKKILNYNKKDACLSNNHGDVFIMQNYFVLKQLYNSYIKPHASSSFYSFKQIRENYQAIRQNVIRTVFTEYKQSNSFYESYNSLNGKGCGSTTSFWSSAPILLIMAELF